MNGTKLDISKFRSLVERNTLDNDRLKQKAEARKSDSRLEPEQEKKLNNNEKMDNVKHHKEVELANKPDNYQHVETENGAVKRKKKKKKKSERGDCLPSTKTLTQNNASSDDKSDDLLDSNNKSSAVNSKLNAGNRFSRVDGPRIPKR